MRRLLPLLLALTTVPAFAEDGDDVRLKPFRPAAVNHVQPVYKVAQGDTVYSIARKFGRDPRLLLWLNRLEESATLPVGKVIFIGDAPVAAR